MSEILYLIFFPYVFAAIVFLDILILIYWVSRQWSYEVDEPEWRLYGYSYSAVREMSRNHAEWIVVIIAAAVVGVASFSILSGDCPGSHPSLWDCFFPAALDRGLTIQNDLRLHKWWSREYVIRGLIRNQSDKILTHPRMEGEIFSESHALLGRAEQPLPDVIPHFYGNYRLVIKMAGGRPLQLKETLRSGPHQLASTESPIPPWWTLSPEAAVLLLNSLVGLLVGLQRQRAAHSRAVRGP